MDHVHYCECCCIVESPTSQYCDGCIDQLAKYLFAAYTQEGMMEALADLAVEDTAKHEDFTYGLQGN